MRKRRSVPACPGGVKAGRPGRIRALKGQAEGSAARVDPPLAGGADSLLASRSGMPSFSAARPVPASQPVDVLNIGFLGYGQAARFQAANTELNAIGRHHLYVLAGYVRQES